MANAGPSDSVLAWSLQTTFLSDNETQHLDPEFGDETWQRATKMLAQGGFGDVWRETCTLGARVNQARAVKQIRKSPEIMPHISRELDVLVAFSTDLNDPEHLQYFVRFLGWFGDDLHLYIALEFVPFGDLQQHIANRPCSEEETALIVTQIAKALRCMHRMGYVHRDLKPANILVASPRPLWHVKLTDFGISKNTVGTELRTRIGTEAYMAPELFDKELASDGGYTSAVDIWALGAVTYCARTGKGPFASIYDLVMFSTGKKRFPVSPLASSSYAFVDFVLSLMDKMPNQRLNIDQALECEWLKSLGRATQTATQTALPQTNIWDAEASAAWNTTISAPAGQFTRSSTLPRQTTLPRKPITQGQTTLPRKPIAQSQTTVQRKPIAQGQTTFLPYRPLQKSDSASYLESQTAIRPELAQVTPPAQFTAQQTARQSFIPISPPVPEANPFDDQFDELPASLRPGSQMFNSGYQAYRPPEIDRTELFYPEPKPLEELASPPSRQATQRLDSGYYGHEAPEPSPVEPSYVQPTSFTNRQVSQNFDSGYHEQINSRSFNDARTPTSLSMSPLPSPSPPPPPPPEQQPFSPKHMSQPDVPAVHERSPSPQPYEPWSEYLYEDPYRTCLTCGLWFYDRNDLFNHLEAEDHGVDPGTLEPEPYERPSQCREHAWVGGEPPEGWAFDDSEPELRMDHADKDPRQCCLTCGKHFNRRAHLFRHIAAEQHGVDPETFEAEPYDLYDYESESSDLYKPPKPSHADPSKTCRTCGESFWSRNDMFEHIYYKRHALAQ